MRNIKHWLAGVALLASGPAAMAGDVSGELIKWHPVTVSFDGPGSNETATNPNPFLDYRLQVRFTAPSGDTFDVPGFFDGDGNGNGSGNVWRVRFSPGEPGSWSYSATLRRGSNVAVNLSPGAGEPVNVPGSNGSFFIADRNSQAAGFLKWGRLQYVGGHYLKFADGPYWIKGGVDSPENFLGYKGFDNTVDQSGGAGTSGLENGVHRYLPHVNDFNSGDPNFTSEDNGFDGRGIIGSLNYLSSQNVNSIYFLPMNLGGDGRETYPFVAPGNSNFNKTHYDISKLTKWNIVLNHAQRKGIAAHFVLAETEFGNENWFDNGSLGNERRLYYRELIARFGYLLAIKWNLSEENDFSDGELRSFADYISALDWAQHQITFHIKPNQIDNYSPHLGDARFDTTSIQYNPDRANEFVETMRARSTSNGRRLVIDLDENSPARTGLTTDNAADLRKRVLYDTYFSGGNIEWYFGYHNLPLGGDMRTENFRTREPMYRYMWYARKFMQEHLPFWNMQPADNLLNGESSSFGGGQVFAQAGQVYAIYLPDASPSGSINLPAGSYSRRWYNPRSGQFQGAATNIGGGNVALGAPPASAGDDWVVLIEAGGSGGNRPPAVSFSQPRQGQNFAVGASISVIATASDSDGTVANVRLTLNGNLVRQDNAAPYQWGQNSQDSALRNLSAGNYELTLTATDDDGATSQSTITITVGDGGGGNQLPVVTFAEPVDGQQFAPGSNIAVVASASDADGTVANVRLFIDGRLVRQENVSPYQWGHDNRDTALQNLAAGSYALRLIVTDNDGATAESTITINVGASSPVEVGLTSINVSEEAGQAIVEARLNRAAAADVEVSVHTIPKTAVNGQDFFGLTRQFTIGAGSLSVQIPIVILDDSNDEGEEFFNLRIFEAAGASIGTQLGTITISDNDGGGGQLPTLSVSDVAVDEGDPARLTVRMSRAATTPVTVQIATRPGEAINGQDFYGNWQTLTLAAGETAASMVVQTIDDTETEPNESFSYRIFNASGATITTATASVLIREN